MSLPRRRVEYNLLLLGPKLHASKLLQCPKPSPYYNLGLEGGGWVVVRLVIDLIAGRGGYQKRESPEVGISAKCHH